MKSTDTTFAGSIPELYDRHLGPILFDPYAIVTARRLAAFPHDTVLEVAAGTGILTRRMVENLPAARIVATDLNQPMLEHARLKHRMSGVTFRQVDACDLPFADAAFDLVLCQFGVMFFADKILGFQEARRVLKPGGRFIATVWASLAENALAETVVNTLADRFPEDPPGFLARVPHGYHDPDRIRGDLEAAGFRRIIVETITLPTRPATHRDPAIGFCQGTPTRAEIENRDPDDLQAATEAVADAIAARFGAEQIEATMQAHMITASG